MRRWNEILVAAGITLLAAIVLTWPLAADLGERLPHDPRFTPASGSDIHLARWDLWWARTAVERGVDPFQCDLVFHPLGHSLAMHDHGLAPGVLSIPLQWAVGTDAALSLTFLLGFALAGAATFALARAAGASRGAALGAGLAWALAPYFLQKGLVHLALAASPWLPLYALGLLRWASAERRADGRRAALGAGLALAAAMLTGPMVLVPLVLTGLALFAVAPALTAGKAGDAGPRRRGLADPWSWGAAALGFTLLTWPWMLAFARDGSALLETAARLQLYHPRLADFFTPSGLHPMFEGLGAGAPDPDLLGGGADSASGARVWDGLRNEASALYLRFGLLGFAFAGWLRDRRARRWIVVALLLWLVAWDPGPQPEGWIAAGLRRVPGLDSLRVPARALPFALLPLCVAGALGADVLWRSGRGGRVLAASLALLLAFESWTGTYPSMSAAVPEPVRALALWRREDPDSLRGAVLSVPFSPGSNEAQGWQTVHGLPVTYSYIARMDPRRLEALVTTAPALSAFASTGVPEDPADLARELAALDVQNVLLSSTAVLEPERIALVLDRMPGWELVESEGWERSGALWWVPEANAVAARRWLAVVREPND